MRRIRRTRRYDHKPNAPEPDDHYVCVELPLTRCLAALRVLTAHDATDPFTQALAEQVEECERDHARNVAHYEEDTAEWEEDQALRELRDNAAETAEAAETWLRGVWSGEIECIDPSRVLAAQAIYMGALS